MTIEKAMDDWLKQQLKRVDAGAFSINSYEHKKNCTKNKRLFELEKDNNDLSNK